MASVQNKHKRRYTRGILKKNRFAKVYNCLRTYLITMAFSWSPLQIRLGNSITGVIITDFANLIPNSRAPATGHTTPPLARISTATWTRQRIRFIHLRIAPPNQRTAPSSR
nr:hypothetical protein Itr_chr07CG17910 [Ipomoea trifida]